MQARRNQTWVANDRKSKRRRESLLVAADAEVVATVLALEAAFLADLVPDPRPIISHRRSPSSPRAGGGGAWLNLPPGLNPP
jgi:hypothetical protein